MKYALAILLSSSLSFAEKLCSMFPENDLYFPAPLFKTIAQSEFEAAMEDARKIYVPLARAQGASLTIRGDWNDGIVNAWAQKQGSQWTVQMFGGMARHPEIGKYGFHVVLCHELGHLFGGSKTTVYTGSTMANEGQADYFSTSKCIRKLYKGTPPPAVSTEAANLCKSKWATQLDREVCEIGLEGGEALGNVLASLRGSSRPSLSKEDPKVVSSTSHPHPEAQCRLDTYKRGALCSVSENVDFSMSDDKAGACLSKELGRPKCWYKPTYQEQPDNPLPDPEDPTDPEPSDIAPDFRIGSVRGVGLMFSFDLSATCPAAYVEVKRGPFTTNHDVTFDKKSYLGIKGDASEDSFIISNSYFKRRVDNHIRYFCHKGDSRIFGRASKSLVYRRK